MTTGSKSCCHRRPIQTKVLALDSNTPDRNVARDPRMVRLTGAHPFNAEPPLSALFDEGVRALCGPASMHRMLTSLVQAS